MADLSQSFNKKRTTAAVSLIWLLALWGSLPIAAADFSQAQHIYVPTSIYERRIDYTQADQAGPQPDGNYQTNSYWSKPGASVKTKSHPYGELPAPPSVPGSSSVVPPPPPYPATLSKAARDLHSQIKRAASSPQVQAAYEQLKQQAEEYVRSGKLNEAKHALAEALRLTPHDKALIRELGAISVQRAREFMQSADYSDATEYARQALAFDTTSKDAHSLLNGLLEKQGINATDPVARLNQAELLASQGKNDEAWVEYQAANNLKPSSQALIGMGNIAKRLGHKDLARSKYLQAAELDPHDSAPRRQLGILKYEQGDVVGANAELSRALSINPKDSDAGKALVELWQNQVAKVGGANSHLGLARAYQLSGDLQSAQAEYRTVVQMDPTNPHLPAARQSFKLALARQEADQAAQAAHTLESQGAFLAALEKMDQAVKLNPADSDLKVYQGYLLEKVGRFADARQAYMSALGSNPNNVLAAARIKELPPSSLPPSLPPSSLPPVWTPAAAAPSSSAYPPFQPAQHDAAVNNISNFAFALRNHLWNQQTQASQVEDLLHQAMSPAAGHSESLVTDGSASALTSATAGSLAATSPSSDGLSSSVASTLAKAREAIARAGGNPDGSSAVTAAGTSTVASSQLNDSAALSLPPVPLTGSPGMPAATDNSGLPPLAPPVADSASAPPLAPALAAHWQSSQPPPLAPPVVPAGASTALVAPAAAPALRGELPVASSGVKFQLLGVNPKLKGVDLNVSLENDSDVPLILPPKVRAIIRYNGKRPDAEVHAFFASSAVPPHGVAQGTVHVPYDKADPTADLILPSLLPATFAQRDVHLTTSVANRI